MLSRLILFVFILLFVQTAHADTFIVTSNADSGPGTLREAITLANANGTAVTDYIHFNIADVSETGRTISLSKALPNVSSNIIIDASTQPGTLLGISTSKIILLISLSESVPIFYGLNVEDSRDVEIYGLFLKCYSNDFYYRGVGVYCSNSKNIKIGAPGKGNIFSGWLTGIGYPNGYTIPTVVSDSIFIQSNIFGFIEDGHTTTYGINSFITTDANCRHAIYFTECRNILIGGNNGEGNLINYASQAIVLKKDPYSDPANFYRIIGNIIGSDYSKSICTTGPFFQGSEIIELDFLNDITVSDNFILGTKHVAGISLTTCESFIIQGNTINIDKDGNQCNSNIFQGLLIYFSKKGLIGGNNIADANIIAYTSNNGGIFLFMSYEVSVLHNSTYCNTGVGINLTGWYNGSYAPEPFITINSSDNNSLSGTSLPNSLIELFIDDECDLCQGKTYIASVVADANGKWSYSGPDKDKIVATATTPTGSTSNFSTGSINYNKTPVINPATCGLANGSITNIEILSGTRWFWEDQNGNVVGTDTSLLNVGAGAYRLVIESNSITCKSKTQFYFISEIPPPSVSSFSTVNASCGLPNGEITVTFPTMDYRAVWISSIADSIGQGEKINSLLPGQYFLKLVGLKNPSCFQTFGPYTLTNQSGPTLNINNIQITSATCENADGSIKNVSASNTTGTQYFAWVDSLNRIVSSTADLLNAPAGKYKLKFKDDGGCDTIITPYYIIPSTGRITIDSSQLKILPAGCTVNNGAINGLNFTNATQFSWQGLPAVNTASAIGLPAGSYTVTASNNIGCSAQATFTVPTATLQLIMPDTYDLVHSTCDNNNGSINIKTFKQNNPAYYTFQWHKRETGNLTGTGVSLSNLSPGNYDLTIIDTNGCSKKVFSIEILNYIAPLISTADVKIYPDQCSTNKGSIMGIKVGISRGPENSYWIDENNNIISHSKDLINIGAGKYQLITKDNDCMSTSQWFTVTNNNIGTTPQYDDQIISRYAPAILKVKNPVTGTYFLYSNPAATQLVSQSTNGVFSIPTVSNDIIYYIKHINGSCTSPVVPVKITVVDKSEFAIANAFTPNNDGVNDLLQLKVLGIIDVEYFKIYNRNGEEVFSTKTIGDGWDGKLKGVPQPNAAFVWMARGKDMNGKTITAKGSFVLIR